MSKRSDELPETVGGIDGESDIVAERSGSSSPRTRRPIPADPPDEQDVPAVEAELDEDEDVTRPDAGPTG
ncbi:hypothetical protein ITP53_50345 [Nonomuraea sp. K274]|uniref:Uncharacterized protein n=1 Tax=Nonomuraea cypriaca TaxID=1187855 RepID=A0A931AML9_9ACTN|nr:hypothetical protein [Nonomuraea cypriaca]MBF8193749.1 hypothetical protein [Nonomuraea cypriaca]